MSVKVDIQKEYIGKKFGMLTVLKLESGTNASNRKYLCKCDCGNRKITSEDNLRRGHCKSCGCLYKNNGGKVGWSKGYYLDSKSKLYSVWRDMIDRCSNPHNKHYMRYGGRGIKICDEWMNYQKFRSWAIDFGYDEKHDRKNCTLEIKPEF